MVFFMVAVVLLAVAIVGIWLVDRAESAYQARKRKRWSAELERTGLALEGDPLGAFELQGTLEGVSLTLENTAGRKLPGASGAERTVCALTFEVPLPDLVVCSRADTDAVMGPLPAVPRTLTGDTGFDTAYSVFVSPQPVESSGDFRTAAGAQALAWARPEALEQLRSASLQWLRVQDRSCQLMLAPVDAASARVALSLALSFARAASGRDPLKALPPERVGPAKGDSATRPLVVGGAVAGFGTFVIWPLAAFLPWTRALTEDWVCGPGAKILVSSSSHGSSTSYGLYCSNAHETPLWPHYLSVVMFCIASTLLLSLMRSIEILHARRAAEAAEEASDLA
ncbi:MAG: hypothetical protein R3B70_33540 [Polyangiaceae bacterium]